MLCRCKRTGEKTELTYREFFSTQRLPHWQATPPASSPPLPTPWGLLHKMPPLPTMLPPLPTPSMAPSTPAAPEAVTIVPWLFPWLYPYPSALHPSPSKPPPYRKALATGHNSPADCLTGTPEVGKYTAEPGGPAITCSSHACLLSPTSSKGDALHLPLSYAVGAPSLCPPHRSPTFITTPGNSDAFPANPNSPLANSNTFSAAINASLDSSKPLEPSPTIPNPIHHNDPRATHTPN
ncbi:hypothetical protein E4T56_gene11983 [Termitomyces sp. T112]|nr:hypothetical protein E4T56_gene11983 [Termitomyces sp. T112]